MCAEHDHSQPSFAIGESVFVLPTVNRTTQVVDHFWDNHLKPEPGFRYKVASSPAWFPESQLKNHEQMREFLESEKIDSDDRWLYGHQEYDADTGRAFINGRWVVVNSRQWERFLLS